MNTKLTLTLAALAIGLAGCGGGGSQETPVMPAAADDVPSSASASAGAYTSFAATLASSETARPLDVSKTKPPTSETAAPSPL